MPIVIIILISFVGMGGLNAREEIGNYVTEADSFYYVRAFLPLFYVQNFITGYLFYQKTWLGKIIFLFVLMVYFIGGHRGELFLNLLSFLIGCLFVVKINFKTYFIGGVLAVFSFLAFGYISIVRLKPTSINSSEITINGLLESEQIFTTLERVYEPSGQRVVDYTMLGQYNYFYFENFSRIITLPIPAFLLKKENNDDGPETLEKYYGYQLNDFYSVPIIFLADAFRRFGFWGVLCVSLGFYIIIWLLNKLILKIMSLSNHQAIVVFLLTSTIFIRIFRLAPSSILGATSFFVYDLPKIYLLILGISYLAKIKKPSWFNKK